MRTITVNDITVAFAPLPPGSRADRSTRERATVLGMVRQLLGAGTSIGHSPSGAPLLQGATGMNISISHSLEQAAVAIGRHTHIGIDTETLRPQLQRVVDKFLSPEEQSVWNTPHRLLTAWCIKEAAYKAAGIAGLDFARDITIISPAAVTAGGIELTCAIVESTPTAVTALCHTGQ